MSSSDPTGGATTPAVQQHDAMYRQPATVAGSCHALRDERAVFFADKATHLLREIAEYENTHPDDAPCLHSQHIEIDGKQVTIKLHEWNALHTAARQSDPIPESSLSRDSEIFRVVCDQHVNGHGVVGGWYSHVQSARDSINVWWKRMCPTCTGWRVEIRRLSPWEPVDD